MKIILARTAGFCMGVRRAIQIAVDAVRAGRAPVHTLGPLIHNPQAVELLAARGIRCAVGEGPPADGTVILRAHGIGPDQRQQLELSPARVIDATCPHVIASQARIRQASAAGMAVVLVGDPDHPEVAGLAAHASTPVHFIDSPEQAESCSPAGRFAVIAQTTFQKPAYQAIAGILRRRFPDCTIHDSICDATERRQDEARDLAARSDVLVVVGGRASANTRRLADIGRDAGVRTIHVETAEELDPGDFLGARTVAITAGASTPGWMTQQVLDRIESFSPWGVMRILRAAARARLITAIAAGALCDAIHCLMTGLAAAWNLLLMVAAFVFAAYTFNRREPPEESARVLVPIDRFYRDHRLILHSLATLGVAGGLALAWQAGWQMYLLFAAACAAAVVYAVPVLPATWRLRRLKDLPASKDLLVAAAWAVVLIGAVTLASEQGMNWKRILGSGLIVFLLVFAKTVMLDLRDSESDHLIGIETLPVLIGREQAIRLVYFLHSVLFALALYLGVSGLVGNFALLFALVPLYGASALFLLVRARFRGEVHCQLVIDGQLLFAGAISALWRSGWLAGAS